MGPIRLKSFQMIKDVAGTWTSTSFVCKEEKLRMKPMLALDNSAETNEPAHPHSQPRYTREAAM